MPYWWSIDGNQSINQIKDHVFEKVRSLVEEKVENKINMTLFDDNRFELTLSVQNILMLDFYTKLF